MKLYIDQIQAQEALKDVGKAISAKTPIPILTGILVIASEEVVTFVGSNSNVIIERRISNEYVNVVEEGSVVIPSKHFIEVVKKLPSRIHLSTGGSRITLTSDEVRTGLNGMDPEEYPLLPEIDEGNSLHIEGKGLKQLIQSTVFAVSKHESNPVLTGVHWSISRGLLQATATNSHRLASIKVHLETLRSGELIVPGETLHELAGLLYKDDTIEVSFTKVNICFQTERFTLYSRLIEGSFPSLTELTNQTPSSSFYVSREEFLKSVDRAVLFASDWRDYNVSMEVVSQNDLYISSDSNETGDISEHLALSSQSGEPFQVTFNGQFMLDALKKLNGTQVKVGLDGTMKPISIQDDREQQLHLISPVRTY